MKKEITYIIGAGENGKVIYEILKANHTEFGGFFDDNSEVENPSDFKYLGRIDQIIDNQGKYLIAIGSNKVRQKLSEHLQLEYCTAIHPSAVLSPTVSIGEGTVVMSGVHVNTRSTIGRHCILNTCATVTHDCIVEDFAHISPGATICGNVYIGIGTHVGAAAVIIPGIRIGNWCTIGAGSVIIRNVPTGTTVVGNPGRILSSKG